MFGIRMDVNSDLGMGHFSRCRCIADELIIKGYEVVFICSNDTDKEIFEDLPYQVSIVEDSSYRNLRVEAETDVVQGLGITTLLVDSYYVVDNYLEAIKNNHCKIVLLDDLCLFDYNVDAIINYNIEADNRMYSKTKYNNRKMYLGVEYFPLRKDLAEYITKRKLKPNIEKVLIMSGGSDPCGCIMNILRAINPQRTRDVFFYVLIGKYYDNSYKEQIRRVSKEANNIGLLDWGQEMGRLYSDVDLVIAPGSTIIYEALSLGTPCITFQFVDNQHGECVALEDKRIADYAGDCSVSDNDKFCNHLRELFKRSLNYMYRREQLDRITGLFDGRGASRISEIMVNINNEKIC